MAKLIEYFNNDFKELSLDIPINVQYRKQDSVSQEIYDFKIEVKQRIRQGTDNSARLFTYYIPETTDSLFIAQTILNDIEKWKKHADGIETIGGYTGDVTIGNHSIIYSNRIFLYTETQFSSVEIKELEKFANKLGLYITIRSQDYINKRMELEKPMAFISHDSRDKDLIARPLSNGLHSRLCFVWYDEFSLKVGDSLRESIEAGIKEAKKCVLILTPHFLSNPGWTKKEFNSIFTREMIFNERIVLPIWHKVTKEDVYDYSPALADTVALIWPDKKAISEEDYNKEVEKIISKIHTEITKPTTANNL
ncbi:toll/interleukin-1 receptor domain-containing protein [Flagellimonas baculiformis]|uniref:toll/interleukin-1 receptor domain-containing protein n=1 Tax=Flagellimonas baculiformis TaxID=3067310 RepID=UPI00296EA25D|nr:toll/interleukin-1 receptor domain-containing protein [Muricauda sp. D6]